MTAVQYWLALRDLFWQSPLHTHRQPRLELGTLQHTKTAIEQLLFR